MYYRNNWRLAVSFVCPDCKCYLKENCPHCKKGFFHITAPVKTFADKTSDEYLLTCCSCQKDISKVEPELAPKHIVEMQLQINSYFEGSKQSPQNSVEYFRVGVDQSH